MNDKLRFATDLYQGTAEYYDRYRLPYPEAMTEDLLTRTGVSGHVVSGQGRLLDLACGTGQLAFPLRRSFAEVWAVDREPDFAQMIQAKADNLGAGNIRPVTADAETLDAEPGHFELAVIGNAFHRLDRDLVAARLLHWLQPGGCVALCWSDAPHLGDREWQRALAALLGRWQAALGATGRVPANWAEPQRRRPDAQVLSEAGFETAGHWEFPVEHRWSLAELAGYVRSTSFLPPRSSATRGPRSTTTSRPPSARSPPPTAPSRTTWASSTTWPASRQHIFGMIAVSVRAGNGTGVPPGTSASRAPAGERRGSVAKA
jgi:SAM-dependent methyltransferase